jgi:hypothetical protein
MKPIVKYEESSFELHESHGGTYAKVWAYDHPRLGEEWVRTSLILRDLDDGGFETMNTIYKPVTRSTEA